MQFVFDFINTSITAAYGWLIQLLAASRMTQFLYSMVFISLVARFILSPIFGIAVGVTASDTVKRIREGSRSKGHYEKNQHGRYSK